MAARIDTHLLTWTNSRPCTNAPVYKTAGVTLAAAPALAGGAVR